jgi:flagellar FliL protein
LHYLARPNCPGRNWPGCWCVSFHANQTPVEQVEELIAKKLEQAGQLPSTEGEGEEMAEPQKVAKETPATQTFVTSYYTSQMTLLLI